MAIPRELRYSRYHPCPICGGWPEMPAGQGVRCWGMLADNNRYAFCTREELSIGCIFDADTDAYGHSLDPRVACYCGRQHSDGPVAPTARRERVVLPPAVTLDPDVLHAVFTRYLALCPLREEHQRYLESRGTLDAQVAREYGYGSLPTEDDMPNVISTLVSAFSADVIIQTPGFFTNASGKLVTEYGSDTRDAVVIPAYNQHRQITGMIRRYIKGSEIKYKTFPGNGSDFSTLAGPRRPALWITEGIHKAHVAATAVGVMMIGLPGVHLRESHIKLIRELNPEEIIEALDADKIRNPSVAYQRAELIDKLRRIGFPVKSAMWDEAHGKGIDDLFKNRHFPKRNSLTVQYCRELADRLREKRAQERQNMLT